MHACSQKCLNTFLNVSSQLVCWDFRLGSTSPFSFHLPNFRHFSKIHSHTLPVLYSNSSCLSSRSEFFDHFGWHIQIHTHKHTRHSRDVKTHIHRHFPCELKILVFKIWKWANPVLLWRLRTFYTRIVVCKSLWHFLKLCFRRLNPVETWFIEVWPV